MSLLIEAQSELSFANDLGFVEEIVSKCRYGKHLNLDTRPIDLVCLGCPLLKLDCVVRSASIGLFGHSIR